MFNMQKLLREKRELIKSIKSCHESDIYDTFEYLMNELESVQKKIENVTNCKKN